MPADELKSSGDKPGHAASEYGAARFPSPKQADMLETPGLPSLENSIHARIGIPAADLAQLKNEITKLRTEATLLHNKLQAIEKSTSWRMSAPLRWFADKLKAGTQRKTFVSSHPIRYCPDIVAVDISNIWHSDSGTGIQRVVRTLAIELARKARDAKKVVLINYADGTPMDVTSGFLEGDRAVPAVPLDGMETLIMLDSSYNLGPRLASRLRQAKEDGIRVVSVCHDLLPLRFPHWFIGDNQRSFRRWLNAAADYSNHFVCVSRATADDLSTYLDARSDLTERPTVSTWPLGRDFVPLCVMEDAGENGLPKPYAVMVGTVEPRKNHAFVLEAFGGLRRSGKTNASLVIVGRHGWKCRQTVKKLRQAESEGWAVWLNDGISDVRLASIYKSASCVIQASRAEGFGLPVAEAAHFGKPVVLSGIPVFREIVSANGYFFTIGDKTSFASALMRATEPFAAPTETVAVSWKQSAEAFWRECMHIQTSPIKPL